MGHHLHAFVGRPEVVARLGTAFPALRLLTLRQGIALAPITGEMIPDDIDDPGGPGVCRVLTAWMAEAAATASRGALLGWLESDFFGGMGGTETALWRDGAWEDPGSANDLLRTLGVVRALPPPEPGWMAALVRWQVPPRPMDEWDSVNLGAWRSSDRAWAAAEPVVGLRGVVPGEGSR